MNRRQFIEALSFLIASAKLRSVSAQTTSAADDLQRRKEFIHPPKSAYPWVYAFWMEGNITKEGITADLEGMHEAGICGMLLMDGALGNPVGPHRFMSESWLEMFDHLITEANRLGIEVNLNNDPGWSGSQGPWVKPEHASQKVIVSQQIVQGPSRFDETLPTPEKVSHNYYRDIAVLAYPLSKQGVPSYRIPDFDSTKSFSGGHDFFEVVPWPRFIPTNAEWPVVSQDQCLQAEKMVNLTASMQQDGSLTWDVPSGPWVILRFGHTVGNGGARSAQAEATGLECDKLSKAALDAHFAAMVGKLAHRAGPLAGKALVSAHIDSWEAGSGNWTNGFEDEFLRRRGYDLHPYLPTLNGIVVNCRQVSERFLWDFRETISELTLENYAEHMRELAHREGLRLTIEGYDGTCDDLRYAGRADEPMSEFWLTCYSGLPLTDLNESMTSAAHVYGKQIIGAEAFTSGRGDFLEHPATLKPLADWAFCTGVNRLCFSEWVMQPWPHLVPGVSFSLFGTVFHQSLTWWPVARPWHEYVARCQHMLRQGNFVADICFVAPEGAPYRFTPPIPATERGGTADRPKYNFDGCPPELVIKGMTTIDGKVALPSGMKYQLLVLPTYRAGSPVLELMTQPDYAYRPETMSTIQTMTPELLLRIKELVEAGATVLGFRPLKSPSLAHFPQCDAEVTELANELWGKGAGLTGAGERRVGKGRMIWGKTPEQVLSELGVPPDFATDSSLNQKTNYIHRFAKDESDIYFIVNQQNEALQGNGYFRVTSKQPEAWWPHSGDIETISALRQEDGTTMLPLSLNAQESVFIVFRPTTDKRAGIVSAALDGTKLWPKPASTITLKETDDSFIMACWITPGPDIVLPARHETGWSYDGIPMRMPGLGYQTRTSSGQGRCGFAIGKNGIVVYQLSVTGEVQALLVYESPLTEAKLVGVLYKNKIPQLFLNGKLVSTGPANRFPAPEFIGWADHRPFAGELSALDQFEHMLASQGIEGIGSSPLKMDETCAIDFLHRCVLRSGKYVLHTEDGKSNELIVHLPPTKEISGPWRVAFDPEWGGPKDIHFTKLISWSEHEDEGVRYYSGKARYQNVFQFDDSAHLNPALQIYLDLGKVANLADVTLNGRHLGTVWNTPYRIDVTQAIKSGSNTLEVDVFNVWANRLIGDEHLPEDSERSANGQLMKWPEWVLQGKKSPAGRFTFTTYKQWNKDSPLIQSGLLGPVRLVFAQKF